jgi:hypothetical protein
LVSYKGKFEIPRVPSLNLSIDTAGHKKLVLWIKCANVDARNCICLERIEESALFEIESMYFGTNSHEVDIAVGRMIY